MTRIAAVIAAVVFLGTAGLILALAADAFASAQERNVRYRYFAEALDPVDDPEGSVSWMPGERPLAREFTAKDERLVGRALGSAWRAHSAAMASGEADLLQDYFSGVALNRSQVSAGSAQRDGIRFSILEQTARPIFYHLDGSVLQVEAEALSARFAMEGDTLSHFQLSRDRVTTTLMNESTGWRIFTHEMAESRPLTHAGRATRDPGRLAGINYYPAETPWRRFWPEFDPAVVDRDLGLISGLGANAVRIFLPTQAFAIAKGEEPLRHLETFLRLARNHGLKVVPTLFDMRPGYGPAMWSDDAAYLRRVLPVLSASRAVGFVDLKNEPDLDFEAHGRALIEAWLRTMSALCREIAPGIALTVGWSDADPAARYTDIVDVVSYHDYAPAETVTERFDSVTRAAEGKPVYVTEIGASSYDVAFGFPGSAAAQDHDLASRLADLGRADGVFVWTLHDFEAPDAAAVGSSPWTKRLQAHFGLFDGSGSRKAAADSVAAAFDALLAKAR